MLPRILATAALCSLALFSPSSAQAELFLKPGQDKNFHWQDYEALKKFNIKGETITVFGPWRGDDIKAFERVFAYFEEATGAKINYASSENYEQQIVIDTQAGSPPHIAILPQPGLLADLAAKGFLTPLGDETEAFVKENYGAGASWVALGTYKGKDGASHYYAYPFKADLKSLVWYNPDNFAEAGYKIPQTQEELFALSEQIVKDGGTPWCIGLGSGGATGWPATDWVEDYLLRMQPPEVYDGWATNAVKFNDPRIIAAIEAFGRYAKNDKFVEGGAKGVASIDFRDSTKGLFSTPPKCYMHRQASFAANFFPPEVKLGLDADFFYFPTFADKKELGNPVLGGASLVTITKDSKGARALLDYMKMPLSHELWMAQTGFLTPLKTVNQQTYANDTLRKQGEILTTATTFRFDGSDLMPGKIGTGAFWTAMIDYVGGASATEVADQVQKSWDELKK